MSESIRGKRETRTIPVKLTQDDLEQLSHKHAKNICEIDKLSSSLKRLKSENKDISLQLCTLEGNKDVECEWRDNCYANGFELIRLDTQEVIDRM